MLTELKNTLYEAEGLVELAQMRPDKTDEFIPLIEKRLEAALAAVRSMNYAPEKTQEPASAEEEDSLYSFTDEEAEMENPVPEVSEPSAAPVEVKLADQFADQPSEQPSDKGKPAFCLNDRFKFRRVIFGGSDTDFNAAMDHLATMDTYDEAKDYFYGELGLDPESAEVEEFMAVVERYFES